MANALINGELAKARIDLQDAMGALGATWSADDRAAIGHMVNAGEALLRAMSSLTNVVERLAERAVG